MTTILLLARLLLAAVFAVAGAAKLADRAGSRSAAEGFGVPAGLAGGIGVLLPLAELAVAGLLLPEATAWWGAVGALALLLVFCAAIGVSLARGRQPDCHCFGQLHSEPAGPSTLLRNGGLALLAVLVVAAGTNDPGPGAVEWIGDLDAAGAAALAASVVAAVAVAACAVLALRLLRAHGRLLLRLDELEARLAAAGIDLPETEPDPGPLAGLPAPAFALPALDGSIVTLDDLLAGGRPALLVFSHPDCGPCRQLAPELAEWATAYADDVELAVVTGGTAAAVGAELDGLPAGRVLLEAGEDVAVSVEYESGGTPAAVLVGVDGLVVSGPVSGRSGVEDLLGRGVALSRASRPEGLRPGSAAPELVLPDLEGVDVAVAAPRPHGALLVFWNPTCGFCQSLRADLQAWEQGRAGDDPELVLVSSGDATALAAEGFASTVLLDAEGAAMAGYRASGTPMAVRLDAEGRVASYLAAGGPEVLALAGAVPRLEVHRRQTAGTP